MQDFILDAEPDLVSTRGSIKYALFHSGIIYIYIAHWIWSYAFAQKHTSRETGKYSRC